MKTSHAGIELIKGFEGCELTAYKDAVGVLTIGYGHTSMAGPPEVKVGMKITAAQAAEMLVRDLVKYEAAVSKSLAYPPTQNQFDAMVSLCYNIGPSAFARSSVLRYFNAGEYEPAAKAFALWNQAGGKVLKGLINRRAAEAAHFRAVSAPPPPDIEPPVSEPPQSFWAAVVELLVTIYNAFLGKK
jgi:lysozyme